jgi:ABC-2 type transport system ATP-binding protein
MSPALQTLQPPRPAATPSAEAPPAVRIDNVGKQYGRRDALAAVTIEVAAGESVAIVGVNGAGKTTLLRCLLDFVRPDTGRIELFGVDSREPRARETLSFLPERFAPPAYLTGHEIMQWLAGLRGEAWSLDDSREAFERFAVPIEAIDRPMRAYSKGMMQKLGLASALAGGRPLLVLDEPMSGLDPLARRALADTLQQARRQGTGLLFTSHALADVQRLCDRMVLIHEGRVRFVGAPHELVAQTGTADLDEAFVAAVH